MTDAEPSPRGDPPRDALPGEPLNDALLRRGVRGAFALGIRQLLVQVVSVVAAVVLARVLGPAEFGIYGITVFVLHLLVVAGDAGLAASLVRETAEPDAHDYDAVFTFQQIATLGIAGAGAVVLFLHPGLVAGDGGLALLVPAALAALVLGSFTTTPVARLERHLHFDRLAVIEVAQSLAFNGVAVAGAVVGLGANAMAAALVARAATGVLMVRRIGASHGRGSGPSDGRGSGSSHGRGSAPWPARWRWDWARVRPRLRFGLAYQAATSVSLVREALVPVYIGASIGRAAVGHVFFAQLLAAHALVVVYMLQRVLMPLFARLQSKPEGLARAVESSCFAVAAVVVPVQTTVLALEEPLVRIVFGEQWLETLPLFRWLWAAGVLEPQLVVAMALLNALGRSGRTLRMVAATTLLSWIAGVPLLVALGPVGFGVASVLLLGVKWTLLREADRAAGARSGAVVVPVWTAGMASAAVTWLVAWRWPLEGPLDLLVAIAVALSVYFAILGVLAFARIRTSLDWLRSSEAQGGDALRAEVRP